MCGLAGILGKSISDLQKKNVLNSIKHRGPDSSGVYTSKDITLIHTRLSILDVTKKASQPMIDKKTGIVILYNGEIYNFKEIRKNELNEFNFQSDSDTEVILKLYIKYGNKFVSYLEGMFAIAIWDPNKHKLFLIRDRFGIKPIYFFHYDKIFAFSSEIKPLINFNINPKIKKLNLINYLQFGTTSISNETFFENIFSVPSGTILTFYKNKKFLTKYWSLEKNLNNNFYNLDEHDVEKEFFNLTNKVVSDHLISDVPVGLTLSSGSDSQFILNSIKNISQQKIESFTYGFNERKYDEIRKIKKEKKDSQLIYNSIIVNSNTLIQDLEESIKDFESPIGGVGTLGMWKLMKLARKKKIPVLLSGEGSDEAFCGYKYYYYFYLWELYTNKKFDLLNKEVSYLKKEYGNNMNLTKEFIKKFVTKNMKNVQAPDGSSLEDKSFLTKNYQKYIKKNNPFANINFPDNFSCLKKRMYIDLFYLKIPKLLWFVDRASMSSGIECRVPFLDRRIIENSYSLPSNLLIKNGVSKNLIKSLLKKKLKIKSIRQQKLFVATPQREWIKHNLKEKFLNYVKNGYLVENKIINYNNLNKEYSQYCASSKLGNSFKFWKILNAEILCKTFFS